MTDIWVLYSTFPNRDEAFSTSHRLIEQKLIACANIVDNMVSIYEWEGKVQQENEVVFIAKTRKSTVKKAIELIKSQHSYDTPCITAWPLADGDPDYLRWVEDQTA